MGGGAGVGGAIGTGGSAGSAGTGGTAGAGGVAGTGGTENDAAADSSLADVRPSGTLALSLDSTIDGDGTIIATSITSADLLDAAGALVVHGTVAAGTATFDLTGVGAGSYFIEVNRDANDLVPTIIDDPLDNVEQRVGQILRASYIGPVDNPVYRINTYPVGQGQIVRYSDGTIIAGEQPYVAMSLVTPKIEIRVLGTAALLSSVTPTAVHAYDNQPFDSWVLNTAGKDHHGDMYNADGGAAICGACHQNLAAKPVSYASIAPTNAWCFHCHNGPGGDVAGFVDSAK